MNKLLVKQLDDAELDAIECIEKSEKRYEKKLNKES